MRHFVEIMRGVPAQGRDAAPTSRRSSRRSRSLGVAILALSVMLFRRTLV